MMTEPQGQSAIHQSTAANIRMLFQHVSHQFLSLISRLFDDGSVENDAFRRAKSSHAFGMLRTWWFKLNSFHMAGIGLTCSA